MKTKNLLGISLLGIIIISASPSYAFISASGMGANSFEKLDTNKDGVITLEEAKAAHSAAFTKMDSNRDNFLTKEEIKAFHEAQKQEGMANKQNEHFKKMDADNNGSISKTEFDNAHNKMQSERKDKLKAKIEEAQNRRFDAFDKNKDGVVSRDEMRTEGTRSIRPEGHKPMSKDAPPRRNPDTDGDTKISKAEWNAMDLPFFGLADANKDNRVTKEEAAASIRGHMRDRMRHEGNKPR